MQHGDPAQCIEKAAEKLRVAKLAKFQMEFSANGDNIMNRYFAVIYTVFSFSVASVANAALLASSEFESGTEGWSIVDVNTPIIPSPPVVIGTYSVDYIGSGGNPGGYISETDPSENWFMFSAPSAFLGNKESAYNGTLSFDMMSTPNTPGDAVGVVLVGAGTTLFFDISDPGSDWTKFSIPLNGFGWRVNDQSSGLEPTMLEMESVLSDLQALYISGDWYDGVDTTGLDNVRLSSVPAPGAFILMAAGIVGLAAFRHRSNKV